MEVVELLCDMEMHLPILIFDIQFHHVVHIIEDVELTQPVHDRWMYYVERYLKVLKDFVQ